ncbi:MAG TPA: tetratricopeptide repeat protein [Planctomycetota bacterium]|nr:tetratricopeptide repeat protein [Planctomycetota bacterium]
MFVLLLACAAALAPAQDGEVDRILVRFQQRREKVRSEAEYRRLLADSRIELESFLKDNPGHKDAPRAAYQIAETYLSGQEVDKGFAQLQAYLKDYPAGQDAAAARFAMAEICLEKEKDAEARTLFEEFVRLHPKDERLVYARLYTAVTYQNEGKYEQAAELLRNARRDYRERKEAWGAMMQLAVVLHVQEKNAEAKKTLEELIRDCPEREPVEIARRHLAEYLKVGQDAPVFSDKDIEGRDTSVDKLRGKVVVIYFFDPAAQAAFPEAAFLRRARDDAAKAGKGDGLEILGVSIGADRKEIPLYKVQARADWILIHDGKGIDGKIPRLFDVRGLPSLTLIDRKGRIRFYNIAGRDFRNMVAKLLEEN